MKSAALLVILLALCILCLPHPSSANPFFAPAPERQAEKPDVAQPKETKPSVAVVQLNALQRDFRERMTAYARRIQESPTGATTVGFLGLTFLYGVIHALGPGHGKTLVGSYFLARKGTLLQALAFGNLITFMHVLSAAFIVFGLTLLGRQTTIFSFQQIEGGVQRFSYLLIFLIGAFLLVKAIRDLVVRRRRAGEEGDAGADRGSMAALSLSAGLIPCPGAALILLFTIGLDIVWAGVAAMLALGAGMGLTNSMVGVVTLSSRGALMRLTRTSPRLFFAFYSIFALSGALIITLLGLSLFLSGA